jgi:hypothetical protein
MTTYVGLAETVASIDYPGVASSSAKTGAGAIKGTCSTGASTIYGTNSSNGAGVHGEGTSGWGVYGYGTPGVEGRGNLGVFGYSIAGGGCGVFGNQGSGSYGVFSQGACHVAGTLTKTGGSFLIDHPLSPAKRLLEHSFVESPERKNVYDGVATADASGEVVVQMPAYFDALNEDFRYQLTPIGAAAPGLHIKQEIAQGRFVIGGAAPRQKVSWQITGNRKDAWAKANPLVVERDKPADEQGLYLNPEAFGESDEKGVIAKRFPPRPPPKGPATP